MYAENERGGFTCPSCGGHWFRTTDTSHYALEECGQPVACKDEFQTGCGWTGLMRPPTLQKKGQR